MVNKKRDIIFKIFGIYFIILAILAVINAFLHPETASPLWFCYIAVLFIGIGILLKKSEFIITQINIMAIPLILWNIDFFYQLITKKQLWGITDYFFATGWMGSLGNFITLQHLYVLPVGLVFIYLLGISKKNLWKWSFLEVVLVFIASSVFSVYEENVNCAFKSCINFITLGSPYYQILWFFSVFLMVFLTNRFLIYIFKTYKKKNQ